MPPLAGPRISSPGPAAQTRAPCGQRGASVLVSKRALRAAERALRKPRGSPSRYGRGPGPVPADSHHCGALTPALPTVGVETALPGATPAPGLVQGATPQCPPAKEPDLPGGWGPERARPEAATLPATMSSGRTARALEPDPTVPGDGERQPWPRAARALVQRPVLSRSPRGSRRSRGCRPRVTSPRCGRRLGVRRVCGSGGPWVCAACAPLRKATHAGRDSDGLATSQ